MRITEELLRKNAEHNEGMLANLEEVALHQLGIERIENLDKLCRHIQILLLQNNQIDRLENLSKLKELKYLNLALNNISLIENLEGCESLEKLDLTCNFIEARHLLDSAACLRKCPAMKELYLTGNPCTDFEAYRAVVVAVADQLAVVDGKEVLPSERILAKQNFDRNAEQLEAHIAKEAERLGRMSTEERANVYSKEYRKKIYAETLKSDPKASEEKNRGQAKPEKEVKRYLSSGEMRQCNEGKYEFKLLEHDDPKFTVFVIQLPRFMDTSLIKTEIFPHFISVLVRDKLTQIRLWEEVRTTPVELKRSSTTGELYIKLEKCRFDEVIARHLAPKQPPPPAKTQGKDSFQAKNKPKDNSDDEIPDLE